MKVKIIITTIIKKPKVGDSYGGYGLNGRVGYWEEPIKRVYKTHIMVADKLISMREYAYQKAIHKLRKKVTVKIGGL
jgi:hypothetical protein